MAGDDNGSVSYTVKELLAKLDGKVDTIILALGSKADKAELAEVERRVLALEKQTETQVRVNEALQVNSAANFTRREKFIGVALALLAVGFQIYAQFGG